ncbi:uncharacterized protein LOC127872653 [Dreissena polymorpha]|uniref:Uncharacterized protein n=1 Tax=Dreissena polymorpha TaxID=45954 RepID=A0A9D4R9A9_DREPO|nr:uncharacterized protein LOC127872653 [Dreissena polymorpha]KAH3859003.1 hypothetical protein DPMN_101649 [Dreissena polymorpha]
MEANTLQSVLRCKYNIHETLQAEGIFVALLSGTMDAVGLFSIGIGERCVVVAGINLCGPHIDYDLKSLTPARLLGVTYKNCSKIITFSSQFKSKQSFQICSSAKAAAIWDEITTAIDCLRSKPSGEIWSSASLTTSSSSGASISGNHLNYRCLPRKMFHAADVSYSLTSLSDSESGPRDAKHAVWRQHVKKGHSLDCANLSFDNFVNYKRFKPQCNSPAGSLDCSRDSFR